MYSVTFFFLQKQTSRSIWHRSRVQACTETGRESICAGVPKGPVRARVGGTAARAARGRRSSPRPRVRRKFPPSTAEKGGATFFFFLSGHNNTHRFFHTVPRYTLSRWKTNVKRHVWPAVPPETSISASTGTSRWRSVTHRSGDTLASHSLIILKKKIAAIRLFFI